MNHIDWTIAEAEKALADSFAGMAHVMLLSPNFYPGNICPRVSFTTNTPGQDIVEFLDIYINSQGFFPQDLVLMTRVFEHLPIRDIDYYLLRIAEVMKNEGSLVITVPDMPYCVYEIENLLKNETFDGFDFMRKCFDIFAEGTNYGDRHSIWTSAESMRYLLTREKLFSIDSITQIDSLNPGNYPGKELVVRATRL